MMMVLVVVEGGRWVGMMRLVTGRGLLGRVNDGDVELQTGLTLNTDTGVIVMVTGFSEVQCGRTISVDVNEFVLCASRKIFRSYLYHIMKSAPEWENCKKKKKIWCKD